MALSRIVRDIFDYRKESAMLTVYALYYVQRSSKPWYASVSLAKVKEMAEADNRLFYKGEMARGTSALDEDFGSLETLLAAPDPTLVWVRREEPTSGVISGVLGGASNCGYNGITRYFIEVMSVDDGA